MDRQPVTSSNIKSVGWEANDGLAKRLADALAETDDGVPVYMDGRTSGVLEVEVASGTVYRYRDVPASVYESIMIAPSIGRAFAQLVRAHIPPYVYEKVKEKL